MDLPKEKLKKWDWTQPSWLWLLTLILTVLGLGAGWYYFKENNAKQEAQRQTDRAAANAKAEKVAEAAEPGLLFLGIDGPKADGLTHIKYQNTSLSKNAVVYFFNLTISDPVQLATIAKYHPKPKEVIIGSKFDKDDVHLIHGYWHGMNMEYYSFYVYPDLYIVPDKPHDFAMCIIDPLLPVMDFTGTFTIELRNGKNDEHEGVTIRSRKK
jgi:hypothetical protein